MCLTFNITCSYFLKEYESILQNQNDSQKFGLKKTSKTEAEISEENEKTKYRKTSLCGLAALSIRMTI
jgi:hypothetical protein